jgi:hypothetical protein
MDLQQMAREQPDRDREAADHGDGHLHQDQADRPQPDDRPALELQLEVAAGVAGDHPRRR